MSYCEAPSFYKAEERVAAKEHRCCECRAPILKGEKHVVCKGCWSGEIEQWRQHEACAQACEFVRDTDMSSEGCLAFGELFDFCHEFGVSGVYACRRDRQDENIQTLRGLLAKIRWRERRARHQKPTKGDE